MRTCVAELVALGQLPAECGAPIAQVKAFEEAIQRVERPLADAEAKALLATFGEDECFGLAWSLVHLVESAPGWPLKEARLRASNPWVKVLLERAS
jgi:hypothetical protein